ncbi:cellulose binding domain-containing protein [Sorangium sp. So ce1504]|uniref:cellulose binding domain-containing protein n=1 Tax=Sorangium sp. So ce1504 TaxID=3133337 RepID=UPI003F63B2C2
MEAELTVPAQWQSGYCALVTVRNKSTDRTTTAWGVVVALNGSSLRHAWTASVTPSDGQLRAVNESYNGTLSPGATASWGFCADGAEKPALVSVDGGDGSSASASSSASSGEGGAAATGGGGGEGGEGDGGATGTVGSGGAGGEGGATTAGAGGEGGATTTAGAGGDGSTTAGAGGEGGATTTAGAGGDGSTTTTTTAGAGGDGSTTTAGAGGAPPLDPACGTATATFADVQPILERSCSNEYCHGNASTPAGGLDLRASAAVGELVSQDAGRCSGDQVLVRPFMPSSSYLINKLNGTGLCGDAEIQMPPGAPLPEADMKTIIDWICAGAPDR